MLVEGSVENLPQNTPGAKQFLHKHPKSDLNKDGILTLEEKEDFSVSLINKKLGGGYVFEKKMVTMSDGVKLLTGIFKPKKLGRYPVILGRTAYGIFAAAFHDAHALSKKNVVFILQDLRGDGGSEGKGTFDATSFDNEIQDGKDTIDWIAKQPFCNGNIGMIGTSGNGFCAYMAYLAKPINLRAVYTNISGGNAYRYWTYHNGVRREMLNWFTQRNIPIHGWPRPTIQLFNQKAYDKTIKVAKRNNKTIFTAKTGWYDIFAESSLDYFESFAKKGNFFIQIDASGHGKMAGLKFPSRIVPADWALPDLVKVTEKPNLLKSVKSRIVYYLMGDPTDPNAPGNRYKMTHVWPVPHVPTSYYMHMDGFLREKRPSEAKAFLSFNYDPRNPVPSVGGDVFIHQGVGPRDQRILKDRKDILRFSSEVLKKAIEITGKIKAVLYIKSDVEDTTFTAKLIDIYPNGYEAIVRDSIMMGRFHAGFDKQTRLNKGKVYKLTLDMWSTALVFNKGHKIAVHISSSNSPKYEVHPNTYEPVASFDDSPIANNTIMLSSKHASKIILPVVK